MGINGKSPPPSLMEASSGETMTRLAPVKKPKGARRSTPSPSKGDSMQKVTTQNTKELKNKERKNEKAKKLPNLA